MNDYIILSNETRIPIEEGGPLSSLVSIASTEETAISACNALCVKSNLSHVTFVADPEDSIYAEYDNLVLTGIPTRENEMNDETPTGRVIVRFGFREKTEIELRLDELEETQAIQDGAIEEIAEIVAEG